MQMRVMINAANDTNEEAALLMAPVHLYHVSVLGAARLLIQLFTSAHCSPCRWVTLSSSQTGPSLLPMGAL